MISVLNKFWVSPCFASNSGYKPRPPRAAVWSLGGGDSAVVSPVSVGPHGVSSALENRWLGSSISEKNTREDVTEKLEPLWDDGYGTQTVKDYFDLAKEIIKHDGGPPRWFCPVSCGRPLRDSPVLLFLPGLDGLGLGLILHEKALGKVFEVRCLHIPVRDRTPFEDLVRFVEDTVRLESASSPRKPVYLVGDSFGGCLALAVAARNPTIDLVLVLANPATSVGSPQLQYWVPILEALPDELHAAVPYLLSFIMANPIKLAKVDIGSVVSPAQFIEQLYGKLNALLPHLSVLADIIPKDTFFWKLKLLRTAVASANSCLDTITAEVLVLASGMDNMHPSKVEAQRLSSKLQNCKVCMFHYHGHAILLEDGVNLLSVIKGTCKYRHSSKHDFIKDFLPPSMSEYKNFLEGNWWYRFAISPVFLSTLEDGKIVRGLTGIPDEGPILLVGYHMLMGLELAPLVLEFLRERNVLIRGVAHPAIFTRNTDSQYHNLFEVMKVFGALPVSPSNLFKLMSTKSYTLLYPGGAREALHRKGEKYKLFWPDQQEFVRMAARFGATIVPFGAVGEDDITELVLDYNDIMRIPVVNDIIRKWNDGSVQLRTGMDGEIANQDGFIPGLLPKLPGRFYYLFGKPIQTKGKEKLLKNRENAKDLYSQIKSEVERSMAYLIKKREEDPYRGIIERTLLFRANSVPIEQVPTFNLD